MRAAENSNLGVSDTDQTNLSHYTSPAHSFDCEISSDEAVTCLSSSEKKYDLLN